MLDEKGGINQRLDCEKRVANYRKTAHTIEHFVELSGWCVQDEVRCDANLRCVVRKVDKVERRMNE